VRQNPQFLLQHRYPIRVLRFLAELAYARVIDSDHARSVRTITTEFQRPAEETPPMFEGIQIEPFLSRQILVLFITSSIVR
jgi:hypothetical protein